MLSVSEMPTMANDQGRGVIQLPVSQARGSEAPLILIVTDDMLPGGMQRQALELQTLGFKLQRWNNVAIMVGESRPIAHLVW